MKFKRIVVLIIGLLFLLCSMVGCDKKWETCKLCKEDKICTVKQTVLGDIPVCKNCEDTIRAWLD